MHILFTLITQCIVSFYTLVFYDVNGTEKTCALFENKKVLVVNIASASPLSWQTDSLEALQQRYDSNLVVVVFPSNSFGNEPLEDSALQSYAAEWCPHVLVAQKSSVLGFNVNPVFNWLQQPSANGVFSFKPDGDFFKFLVDEAGQVTAVFDSSYSPTDAAIIQLIHP